MTSTNSCKVESAKLKLKFIGNALDSHSIDSGANSFYVSRVIENWGEDTLRWKTPPFVAFNRMPISTSIGQKEISGTTVGDEDYEIDITDFINFWRQYPDSNFGLEFRLKTESGIRSLNFASGNHPNPALRPSIDMVISSCSKNLANAGSDKSVCEGQSIELDAQYGEFFSWFNTEPIAKSTLSNLYIANPIASPNRYKNTYVLETTLGSCKSYDTVVITRNQYPIISVGSDEDICLGDSVELEASGGLNYLWLPNTNIVDNKAAKTMAYPKTNTSYVIGVDSGNTCIKYDTTKITVRKLADTDAGESTILCEGENIQLNATGGTSYKWINNTTGLSATNIANPIASPTVTTTYTVEGTNGFCPTTDTIRITVIPKFTVNAGNDFDICIGDTAFFNAEPGFKEYIWSPSSQFNKHLIADPYVLNLTTDQTFSLTVEDDNGCKATDDINVRVNSLPYIDMGRDTFVCLNESVIVEPDSIKGLEPIQYSWLETYGLSEPNIKKVEINGLKDTLLFYPLLITDANGCTNKDSFRLTVLKRAVATAIGDTTICQGETALLTGKGGIFYEWTPEESVVNSNTKQKVTVKPDITTTYRLVVRNNEACGTAEDFVTVRVNPLPTIRAPRDTAICKGRYMTLTAQGADNFIWSTGDSTESVEVRVLLPHNLYTVTGYTEGCKGNVDTVVLVTDLNDSCSSKIFVPNVFSPNDDGVNDSFTVKGFKIRSYNIIIYNRWGQFIFESSDLSQHWDGKLNGEIVPEGVYYYSIEAFGEDEESRTAKGTFHVIHY